MPNIKEQPYEPDRIYFGKSEYQSHCDFINSILSNIRKGESDYCYYIYQIAELLQFEQENLEAIWLEEDCAFCVSLKIRPNNKEKYD